MAITIPKYVLVVHLCLYWWKLQETCSFKIKQFRKWLILFYTAQLINVLEDADSPILSQLFLSHLATGPGVHLLWYLYITTESVHCFTLPLILINLKISQSSERHFLSMFLWQANLSNCPLPLESEYYTLINYFLSVFQVLCSFPYPAWFMKSKELIYF